MNPTYSLLLSFKRLIKIHDLILRTFGDFCLCTTNTTVYNTIVYNTIKMFQKLSEHTLSSDFSCKTIPCGVDLPNLKTLLKNYLLETSQVYERLFEIIKEQSSFYTKPQPLRHPLIFYFGHTSAFFINKFIDKGLIAKRVNESYERMFAVGVDEMDWDDLNEAHYDWPTVAEAKAYRKQVRQVVMEIIDQSEEKQLNWNSDLWIVLMGIQHQKIHLETSAVIIRRLPINEVIQPGWAKACPHAQYQLQKVQKNQLKRVPAFQKEWDRKRETAQTYGWDNEFGHKTIKTQQYNASKMLVSNAEYLQFVNDNGYNQLEYWTIQGQNWLKSTGVQKPLWWHVNFINAQFPIYELRTLTQLIQMPWDWPVEVNNLEASAFCQWKAKQTKRNIRLPTEDEYFAMRNLLKTDLNSWKPKSVGNINLEYWLSPNPVDMFETQGFFDIVGNVWQHTITPIYPFEGFQIHPIYEDFTTPTFDNRHNIIKGGSFISTGNQALYHGRYAFRRHFYQFAGFRYVQSSNQTEIASAIIDQSDQTVQKALQLHFNEKNSYIHKMLKLIEQKLPLSVCSKSLVVGCSVGRLPLQLSKKFSTSYGIDYSARYFQMATRLLQKKYLKYRSLQINFDRLNLTPTNLSNVSLHQMNPVNTDNKKINGVEFMIIDGFSIRANTLQNVIKDSLKLCTKSQICYLMIATDFTNNKVHDIKHLVQQAFTKHSIDEIDQVNIQDCENQKLIGKISFIVAKPL